MLKGKIRMFLGTICVLLTHINVSDLIELHNITLAVCLQICSVQSISTQLINFGFETERFAKFCAKLLFFGKEQLGRNILL